tara:strand:- start:2193 stop:2744 length:552 start_codon:yes stop_codon:yes gene_type:complete
MNFSRSRKRANRYVYLFDHLFFPNGLYTTVVLCLKRSLILSLYLCSATTFARALSLTLVLLRSTRCEECDPFALSPLTNASLSFQQHFEHFDLIFPDKLLVDFTATWCGPCKAIGPYFEELAAKFPDVTFVKVDVDELDDVAASCGISAMPTFQLYSNGVMVKEMCGADKAKLEALANEANEL